MSTINLSIQDVLRAARRTVREQEWREASLAPGPAAEVPYEIDESLFENEIEVFCASCKHPKRSHFRLENDPGCYHTFGCTCLAYVQECTADAFTEDGPCPECEYEPGRSEADRIEHVENCKGGRR